MILSIDISIIAIVVFKMLNARIHSFKWLLEDINVSAKTVNPIVQFYFLISVVNHVFRFNVKAIFIIIHWIVLMNYRFFPCLLFFAFALSRLTCFMSSKNWRLRRWVVLLKNLFNHYYLVFLLFRFLPNW